LGVLTLLREAQTNGHGEITKSLVLLQKKDITRDIANSPENNTVSVKDLALWSPILAQSNLIIQFWNITIKVARQHTNVSKRLKLITNKMTTETRQKIQNTSGSATRAMRKAIKNHNLLVKEHKNHRVDHLQQRVED
jgi:hypothetical protein